MEPVTIGLILAGLGAAASAGSQVWSASQQDKAQKAQEDYLKRKQAQELLDARRAAIGRAIGSKVGYMPGTPEPIPEAPSTLGPAILGGLGQVTGTAGSMYAAEAQKPKLTYAAGAQKPKMTYGEMGKAGLLKGAGQ